MKERYERLIRQQKKTESIEVPTEKTNNISKKQEIPKEVVEEILSRLSKFETNQEYLNPKVDLSYLAKKLKTNTAYLSKVINSQKEKNFTTYLNELRINYLIELLKKETAYREYSLRSLAEHIGYSNPRQFSIAFYEVAEMRPNNFLKMIQEEADAF